MQIENTQKPNCFFNNQKPRTGAQEEMGSKLFYT